MAAPALRPASLNPYLPWTDRAGRVVALKLLVFLGTLAPALWLLYRTLAGDLGAKPVTEAIHVSGDWAIRFLAITLAVTPLRVLTRWNAVVATRRMLGLAAMFYALLHLVLYFKDQQFAVWTIVTEIALRFYLTIGFVALLGLVALGWTSTDGWIKRLGAKKWNRLHWLIYPIAVLAAWHYFLQSKSNVSDAVLMAGLFLLAFLYRGLKRFGWQTNLAALVALAIVAGLATAGVEYLWYATQTGIPAGRVLAANLNFAFQIRPAWWVLLAGLIVVAARLVAIARDKWVGAGRPQPRTT